MPVSIRLLKASDIPVITDKPSFLNFHASAAYFKRLLAEQKAGTRVVLVARYNDTISGFVTIKWTSDYPPFAADNIPEINDLRVHSGFRRRGVVTALMDEAEKRIFKQSRFAGLGVGLYADYGPAQQMYVQRGYIPDGRGLGYKNQPVSPGHNVFVDDDLLLYFIKLRK
jgi:ribosomal protein S18 acetylase RimI-like enzyme